MTTLCTCGVLAASVPGQGKPGHEVLPDVHTVQHFDQVVQGPEKSSKPSPRRVPVRRSNSWPRNRKPRTTHSDRREDAWLRNSKVRKEEVFQMDESRSSSVSETSDSSSDNFEHEYFSSGTSTDDTDDDEEEKERNRLNLSRSPNGKKLLSFMDKRVARKNRKRLAKRRFQGVMERKQRQQEERQNKLPSRKSTERNNRQIPKQQKQNRRKQ